MDHITLLPRFHSPPLPTKSVSLFAAGSAAQLRSDSPRGVPRDPGGPATSARYDPTDSRSSARPVIAVVLAKLLSHLVGGISCPRRLIALHRAPQTGGGVRVSIGGSVRGALGCFAGDSVRSSVGGSVRSSVYERFRGLPFVDRAFRARRSLFRRLSS